MAVRKVLVAMAAAAVAGCVEEGGPPASAGLEETMRALDASDLGVVQGCWDMQAGLASPDDRSLVRVVIGGGLGAEAVRTGVPGVGELTLPHPDVTVTALRGRRLSMDQCSDVLGASEVDASFPAVAGTVSYTVTPDPDVPLSEIGFFSAWLDLDLDLEFADAAGRRADLQLAVEGIEVGGMGH